MKRDLSVERLFPLGDYKNVKFISEIKDIPDEFVTNEKVIGLIYFGQALECDIAYRKYFEVLDAIAKGKVKDVLAHLEEKKQQTYLELKAELENLDEKKLTPLEEKLSQVGESEE